MSTGLPAARAEERSLAGLGALLGPQAPLVAGAALSLTLAAALALVPFFVVARMALASLVMAPLAALAMTVAMRDVGKANQQWDEPMSALLGFELSPAPDHATNPVGLTTSAEGIQ